MPMPEPVDPDELEQADQPEGLEPPPGPMAGLLGQLPRFPRSTPRPRPAQTPPGAPAEEAPPLTPPPPDQPAPAEPKTTARSSRASTDEVVDLKDLQAAVRQAADVAFVSVAQLMGAADKRARGLPQIDDKWKPTKAERAFVNEPAARIAKRHMHADVTALDTIDGLMIAVGVGGFTLRRAVGIEPLEDDE